MFANEHTIYHISAEIGPMEQTESTPKTQGRSPRRSLAVDDETFQALLDICKFRGWTKIEALKRLIGEENDKVARESEQRRVESERAYSRP
jgi:hypothetical protein|tara:strand:+ start:2158 stop:2430 length:273 start_codon:yes stop_codon:yes gene_type:complete